MKQHLRIFALAITVAFTALLGACAQLGMQSPDTFNKRVAAAYVTVQTVADGATAALTAGKLSKSDATNVVTTGRTALQAIDVAAQLHSTNPKAGEDKLAATLAILTALQGYLATQGAH